MKRLAALFIIIALLLHGCSRPPVRCEAVYLDVFDTATAVTVYAASEAEGDRLLKAAHDELAVYHRLYDIYNSYDGLVNLNTLNASAAAAPVTVDGRIIDLLLFAADMYELTDGRVNAAMGGVLRIWHDAREAGIDEPQLAALPDMTALAAAAEHTDMTAVVINADLSTVYFEDSELSLDVGALAKGYAAERTAEALRSMGAVSAMVSVGGNVRAVGARADGKLWRVGIQSPFGEADYVHTLAIEDMSVVTSGSYQRFYTVDGVRYHHIIDPATLMPADRFVSVTVVCRDSALADALSTALFNMSLDEGLILLSSVEGAEALWITADGVESSTAGFAQYIAD